MEKRRIQILLLVCLGQFMLLVDDTIVNVALPSIQRELGFSESGLTWVANAYFLAFGGFLLLGGKAADLLGRRRVLVVALAAFATASAVCGLAPSAGVLVGARGVQGLAGAFVSPAALSILLATFPGGRERTQALGAWAALTGIGAATGLLAGGTLVQVLDWRWVFLINVPVALAAVPMIRRAVPADPARDATRARPDVLGALLGTSALLVFTLTVVRTDDHAWTSAWTLGGIAVAIVLAAAAFLRERRSPEPLIPRDLLRSRTTLAANGLMLVGAAGLFAMFFFLTLYMQLVLGWGALETGAAYLPFSFVMAVTSGIVAKALDGRTARPLLLVGPVVGGAGLWLMSGLEATSAYTAHLLPALLVTALGLGLTFVPLINAATGGAGEADGGGASALLTTCQQVGAVLGIAVMVTIATGQANDAIAAGTPQGAALVEGFQAAFRVQAAVLAAAGLLALLIRPAPRTAAAPAFTEMSGFHGAPPCQVLRRTWHLSRRIVSRQRFHVRPAARTGRREHAYRAQVAQRSHRGARGAQQDAASKPQPGVARSATGARPAPRRPSPGSPTGTPPPPSSPPGARTAGPRGPRPR